MASGGEGRKGFGESIHTVVWRKLCVRGQSLFIPLSVEERKEK